MKILTLFLPLYPSAAAAGVLLLQATVAALLGIALSALAGRHRPALRSAIGICAFAAILFSPLGEKGLRNAGFSGGNKPFSQIFGRLPSPTPWSDYKGKANSSERRPKNSFESDPGRDSKPASALSTATGGVGLRLIAGLALALWAAGSIGLLLRIVGGLFRLGHIRRAAVRLSGRAARVAEETADEIGLHHTPPIYSTPEISSPWVAGLLNPSVLLPSSVCDTLSAEQLREIYLHEFAHILRRDLWTGLVQRLAVAAFWPSPFVHWLNASLNRAREEVCDNYVIARVDAAAYSETLLRLASGMSRVPATACALGHETNLVKRVSRLLDSRRNPKIAIRKSTTALLLGGFLLCVSWIGLCAKAPGAARTLDHQPDLPTAASVIAPGSEALAQAIISWRWTWQDVSNGSNSLGGIQFYRGGLTHNSGLWTARWKAVAPHMLVIENPDPRAIGFGENVYLTFDADFMHYVGFDFDGTSIVEGFRGEALDPNQQRPESTPQAAEEKDRREAGAHEPAPTVEASPSEFRPSR